MKDKNVVFMGTPEFAVPVLEMLIEKTNVIMVVTQPDKIVGRKKEIKFSPVKEVAIKHNIEVFQPSKIRLDYEPLKDLDIDLIVTCAFGQILPKEVLDLPKYGSINVHASILPKYRGSAPIEYAIMNGDKKTGVTIMYMDEGMDTGDIIKISKLPIEDNDTGGSIHDKLSILGKDTLECTLKDIFNGNITKIKQGDEFSIAPKITREDEHIDFNNNGINIINKIRAFNPSPLANIIIDNKEIKVLAAKFVKKDVNKVSEIVEIDKDKLGISCKDGIIYLSTVKPMGKNIMDIKSFLNGLDKKSYLRKKVS
ncbi:MAG TPA: methionyl-tRNA formyltransferase [Candidatus Onthocola stercorigallinarum]|nr:methionyl-tRNA formyltransferase [Candidatus Onthocola stercorigallinarum]